MVGELKNFYLTENAAFLQHIVFEKDYWNKGYLTNVCEYLLKNYVIHNENISTFIFEEIRTKKDDEKYTNNVEKQTCFH